ncbi:MAG: hypothetical protein GVY11_07695, partial [Gammaproteobacteria bacterium]|nr:hypothetical protein [Gammaproteobacteria bacterium]
MLSITTPFASVACTLHDLTPFFPCLSRLARARNLKTIFKPETPPGPRKSRCEGRQVAIPCLQSGAFWQLPVDGCPAFTEFDKTALANLFLVLPMGVDSMKQVAIGSLLLLFMTNAAVALDRFDQLTVVVDTTVNTLAGAASRQEGIEISSSGAVRIIEFGAPATVQIEGLDRSPSGTLLVPDVTTKLAGLAVSPRDVLQISPEGEATIAFEAETLGLEPPAKIASIEAYGSGILFTLNISSIVSGEAVSPRDIAY